LRRSKRSVFSNDEKNHYPFAEWEGNVRRLRKD